MKAERKHLYAVAIIIILISCLLACTKEQGKEPSRTASATDGLSKTDGASNARVAELMQSMNMKPFAKPVMAEDFELTSVKGEKVRLSQYRGKVVLLSFWTTW